MKRVGAVHYWLRRGLAGCSCAAPLGGPTEAAFARSIFSLVPSQIR